jgi:hypothetical protein
VRIVIARSALVDLMVIWLFGSISCAVLVDRVEGWGGRTASWRIG